MMNQDDKKTDGYILLAEPYPHDEELMTLHLQYAESAEEAENHQFKFKTFFLRKTTGQMLSNSLIELLSASDTESAWERIANNSVDPNCCLLDDRSETVN